jgi:hypothetical protein
MVIPGCVGIAGTQGAVAILIHGITWKLYSARFDVGIIVITIVLEHPAEPAGR